MTYTYLVSYINYNDLNIDGCGRLELNRNRKIKNMEDIESIEELIHKQYGYGKVLINNYTLMNKRFGKIKHEKREIKKGE